MDKLRRYFRESARSGKLRSLAEMRAYAEKRELDYDEHELQKMRFDFEFSALHGKFTRPKVFQTNSIPRFGYLQADLAEYKVRWKSFNGGKRYFICMVELFSQRVGAVATRSKSARAWEEAIDHLITSKFDFNCVSVVSDRESALDSSEFKRRMAEKYNISFIKLYTRQKAYFCELVIRRLKEQMSQILRASPKRRKWTDILQNCVDAWNDGLLPGTGMKRKHVNKSNYLEVLSRMHGVEDFTPFFNVAATDNLHPELAAHYFRYAVGDKVLLARKVDYAKEEKDKAFFEKPSVVGSFSKTIFVITARKLKSDRKLRLLAVYKIREEKTERDRPNWYYEQEIKRVTYA